MAVVGKLTKKKMIDTASLFKQRRRSIGRGAGSRPAEAGKRGLKVAPARFRRLSAFASARLPERRREIGWSRDCWRCSAANKPALAGLGEITNKTNKLAKRPGSWGGAWVAARHGRRGLGFWSPRCASWRAAAPSRSSPGKPGPGPYDLQGRWQPF